MIEMSQVATQKALGDLVGVSQQAIGSLVSDGKITLDCSLGDALQAYCERLRSQAAGRLGGEVGGLDLVQERAALARSQREAQDLKNATLRGEYAPVGVLEDVLAMAASGVVDRFDQLEGALKKVCPDLDEKTKQAIMSTIASARNEWIRATSRLIAEAVDHDDSDDLQDAALQDDEEQVF